MRYLILTDIHANIDALDALDEPYDLLLVLGDLVDYGAAPSQAIQWVRERAMVAVSGNHDYAMATGADCRSSPISYALSVATREHFQPLLRQDEIDYLGGLPERFTLQAGGAQFHLVHATPRDPRYEYLSGDADEEVWRAAVGELAEREEWLFVGHTHRPFLRRIGRLTVVNPGSLGMPVDGDPRACYAVWEDGEAQLKRVAYDVERAVRRLRESGLPEEVAAKMSAVLRYAGRAGCRPEVMRVLQTKDETKAFYNKISKVYDLLADQSEAPVRHAGLEKLNAHPGERALEIGFGTGHCLIALAQAVGPTGKVYGIDLSEEMLKVAQGRLEKEGLDERAKLTCGDATELPYSSETMDAIFTSFTLELFDTPEIPRVLAECRRALRPGGRIVVVGMSKEGEDGIILQVYEWTHKHFPNFLDCRPIFIRRALEDAGFRVEGVDKRTMWFPVEIVLAVK